MNKATKIHWRKIILNCRKILSILIRFLPVLAIMLYFHLPDLMVKTVKASNVYLGQGTARIDAAIFSHDGSRIVAGDGKDTIYWLDAGNGKVVKQFKFDHPLRTLKYTTGTMNAVILHTGFGGVYQVDPGRGEILRTYDIKTDSVTDGLISNNGQYLVAYNASNPPEVWDLTAEKMVARLGTIAAYGASIASDSRRAITCHEDGSVNLWDLAGGKCIKTLPCPMNPAESASDVVFTSDGKRAVALYVGEVGVWDLEAGTLEKIFRRRSAFEGGGPFASDEIRISPDGKRLFVTYFQSVLMYDIERGKKLVSFDNGGDRVQSNVKCIDLSPDGRRLISGHRDGQIRIYEVP